jgi:thiamine pyrophosphokinase
MSISHPYHLLICNGAMTAVPVVRTLSAHAVATVCADGGANAARACGVLPDLVLGDLDSITAETRAELEGWGVEIEHLPGQDDTDFEKALLRLGVMGAKRIAVLGLTGGLLDHTLGNLSILLRHARDAEFVLFDPDYRIDLLTGPANLATTPGTRVSIVPLSPVHGLRYTGLRYQFAGSVLTAGAAEGTCNEAVERRIRIEFEDGVLLVFRALEPPLWEELIGR